MYINLKAYDGTHFWCAENGGGGQVNATRTAAAQWETWEMVEISGLVPITNGSKVHLRTCPPSATHHRKPHHHHHWRRTTMLTRARAIITCAAAATAAALAASLAAPALATARPAPSDVTAPGGGLRLTHQAIGRITAAPISNRDFAGYQTTVTTGSATVSAASFTVPTLSCTTKDRAIAPSAAVWVNNYRSLSAAFVFTGCVNGRAKYFPGLVSNGREFDHTTTPFAAGDVIDLTTKVSTAGTKIIVTDVTTGVTVQHLGRGASAKAAFIGDASWANRNGSRQGVPNFERLRFTNCLIDGKSLGSWHPKAYQRVNGSGTVEIATGGLWPGGTTFNTFFRQS